MDGLIPCCSICLISLAAFDEPSRLRNCGHAYHKDCVRSWLRKTPLCPDCRKPAVEGDIQRDFVLCSIIDQLKSLNISSVETSATTSSLSSSSLSSSTVASAPREAPSGEPNNTNNNMNISSINNSTNTNVNVNQNPNQNQISNPNSNPNPNSNNNNNNTNNSAKRCPAYHQHPLTIVSNPKTIYPPHGQWFCDICSAPSSLTSQMHHCMECGNFDMCAACFVRGSTTTVHHSIKHPHPLAQCDPNVIYSQFRGKWHCNICRKNNQSEMYHCFPCKDFDMCSSCVNR